MTLLSGTAIPVYIAQTNAPDDLQWAATIMCANEPWKTLQRNYAASLAFLQDPLSEVYLLTSAGKRMGIIMLKLKGSFTGYIQTIVVAEEARGKGIGAAAIRFAEDIIFSLSPNAFICVSSFNPQAQKLYERMGYQVVGLLKDYIIAGYDEVLMRKTTGPMHDFKSQNPVNA